MFLITKFTRYSNYTCTCAFLSMLVAKRWGIELSSVQSSEARSWEIKVWQVCRSTERSVPDCGRVLCTRQSCMCVQQVYTADCTYPLHWFRASGRGRSYCPPGWLVCGAATPWGEGGAVPFGENFACPSPRRPGCTHHTGAWTGPGDANTHMCINNTSRTLPCHHEWKHQSQRPAGGTKVFSTIPWRDTVKDLTSSFTLNLLTLLAVAVKYLIGASCHRGSISWSGCSRSGSWKQPGTIFALSCFLCLNCSDTYTWIKGGAWLGTNESWRGCPGSISFSVSS